MANSKIEAFYSDHEGLAKYLEEKGEASFVNVHQDIFRRSFALAIASAFEREVSELLRQFARVRSNGNAEICALIDKKAINRQYHTLFNWDGNNANSFFAHFGQGFADKAKRRVQTDAELEQAVRAFLALGHARNLLVHNDFVTYSIGQTSGELLELYRQARPFISFLERELVGVP